MQQPINALQIIPEQDSSDLASETSSSHSTGNPSNSLQNQLQLPGIEPNNFNERLMYFIEQSDIESVCQTEEPTSIFFGNQPAISTTPPNSANHDQALYLSDKSPTDPISNSPDVESIPNDHPTKSANQPVSTRARIDHRATTKNQSNQPTINPTRFPHPQVNQLSNGT